jgi:hypothetical protein
VGGALNAEFLHSMAEGIWMQIEDFRGTFRSLDHSRGQFEGGHDMPSLDLFEGGEL